MGIFQYWRTVARRAWQEAWRVVTPYSWSSILRDAVLLSTALALLYLLQGDLVRHKLMSGDNLQDTVVWIIFVLIAAVAVFSAVFVFEAILKTPWRLWREGKDEAHGALLKVAEMTESAEPRLLIEGLKRGIEDPKRHYLLVRNGSRSKGLTDCLARIESLTNEDGNELVTFWPLRTYLQKDGHPEGRFNLDPDQQKLLLLCERVDGGSFQWRILAAQCKSTKLPNGKYRIRVRVTSGDGRPTEAIIVLSNGNIELEPPA